MDDITGDLVFRQPTICHRLKLYNAQYFALSRQCGLPVTDYIQVQPSSLHIASGYMTPCGQPAPHQCTKAHDCCAFDVPDTAPDELNLAPPQVAFADPENFDSVVMAGVDGNDRHCQMGGRLRANSGSGATWAGYWSEGGQSGGGIFPIMGGKLLRTPAGEVLMCGVHTGSHNRHGLAAEHNMNHFSAFVNGLPEGPEFLQGADILKSTRVQLRRSESIITDMRAVRRMTTAECEYRRINNLANLSYTMTGHKRASKVTEDD